MSPVVIQIIGWMGMAAFLISYQMKSNKALYLMQVTGCGLFCLQFLLMGAFSGCFSLALNMLRGLMLSKYKTWNWVRSKIWVPVFCAAFTVILIATWAGPISLLAYTASVVSTICYWTNNAGLIRLSNLACASPCWIVYDILVGSWGGIASETIAMLSIIISIFRFGWKNLFDKDSTLN